MQELGIPQLMVKIARLRVRVDEDLVVGGGLTLGDGGFFFFFLDLVNFKILMISLMLNVKC